ncbi:MAG TPA: flagellar export chaperone FliS [Phycisphaerales bacterium]|nr:flagellar export chaperone FliS [Phycisphaerales bacterium]HRQ75827.1 flagellar export chaperone FliS [Phycisphaerales bacterium]
MPATPASSPNAYLRTKVLTASPAELRLMLLDGAIKFAEQSRTALEQRDYEGLYVAITRCQNIVMELINSLKPEHDPDLCERLSSLYTYIYTRLVSASTERDPQLIAEAIGLLRFERETWVMLMSRLVPDAPSPAAGQVEQAVAAKAGTLSLKG